MSQFFGKFGEDADDFASFGVLQFAQFVVEFYDFDRFDVKSPARRRFVVDESVEFAFVGRRYGNDRLAVAHR